MTRGAQIFRSPGEIFERWHELPYGMGTYTDDAKSLLDVVPADAFAAASMSSRRGCQNHNQKARNCPVVTEGLMRNLRNGKPSKPQKSLGARNLRNPSPGLYARAMQIFPAEISFFPEVNRGTTSAPSALSYKPHDARTRDHQCPEGSASGRGFRIFCWRFRREGSA